MRTTSLSLLVLALVVSGFVPARGDGPAKSKPAAKPATSVQKAKPAPKPVAKPAAVTPEAKAKADYEAAEKVAKAAEAAVAPLRDAMRKADTAYANARKVANAKRQRATDTKNLAGEPGVQELKRAEANVPAAIKALTDATNAKPPLDKALAEAKTAAAPLQQAYDAAEKVAKEAEAVAKAAADAANKLATEAKRATAQAVAKRRAADAAKTALTRAQQGEQNLQKQAGTAAEKLAEATKNKNAADAALAAAKKQVADAEAAAKGKAADDAKAALAKAQQAERAAQATADDAAQKLTQATSQKKLLDAALAGVKKQVATAAAALAAAEKAAQDLEKVAEAKSQAAAQAAAKRKAAADAAAALAQARQAEQQAQAQVNAAAKALAGAKGQKLTEAQARKKAADAALASAKAKVAAATTANQAAREAAKELLQLDEVKRQTAAVAAAKRKVANEAKAVLAPKAKTLEQAAIKANAAARALDRAQKRKTSAEAALASLKKRIASAKQTHVADEKAAKEAEAVAVPLKAEADKTRAAYLAAVDTAAEKRALAQRAKAAWYRLIAARQAPKLMESPDPPKPANRIDEIVFAKLKSLGIKPALCSDAVFVRRAFLDLTGKLPTAEEAKAFIQSSDKNKRIALVDRLLQKSAHFDYWAMKWSDILRIKAEFPVKVWPNAAQAYYRWVWESIAQNKPYDKFARELLTSSGSNFRVGPVNFYRAIQSKTPEGITAAVGLALMGTRVHLWPEDRRAGMAVFFSQVGYKPTSEWKEEIVFWDPLHSTAVPGSTAPGVPAPIAKSVTVTNQIPQALAKPLSENGPLAAVFPDGAKTTIPPNRDPREVFADWLIRPENPWFARASVNRTWAWAMGRGIIHEPDDIREDNPPSNPELLAYLEKEFVSSGYDLKHLKRLIFTSTTYQFSSIPKSKKPEAKANFASYLLRRVEAEVLIDALNGITGSTDLYTSAVPEPFTYIPSSMPAVALADGSISSSFLTLFGRSARATGMENERVNELASPQWLYMLNSATIQSKLQTGPKLRAMISSGKPNEITERLYLTILSRFPTDADVKAAEAHAKTGVAKGRDVWIDLAWALINSPEFLLRH